MIGQVLGGRYELREVVGDGGMSTVYKAHCQVLDRIVAIKVLKKEFSKDTAFVERFREEALAVAKISHPNIVNIFDVGQEEDNYYIVMEYVEGRTLKDMMTEEGLLPLDTAIDIVVMVLDGLQHAHEKGIIHRDIKPQNILITNIGMVKVADFGIAKSVGSGTITAEDDKVMGTVQYIAPEQARGEPVTRAVDIYSTGCMLYEMLTGQIPFDAESPMTIALKHVHDEVEAPSSINPDVPPGLEGIVFKAMEKLPRNRFSSAEDMRNALISFRARYFSNQGYQEDADAYAHYRPGMGDQHKPVNYRRWLIAVIVLAIFCGVAGGILYYMSSGFYLFGKEVQVPDIVGLDVDTATDRLKTAGLTINVTNEKYDEKIPIGRIVSQDPRAESRVKEGRQINVIVSMGTKEVEVLSVVGLKQVDAEGRLKKQGLEIGAVTTVSSEEYEAGVVIYQYPGPGQKVQAGRTVDLKVSSGKEKKNNTEVPNLLGLSEDEAKAALEAKKFKLGTVSRQDSDEFYVDEIMSQSVDAETQAEEGAVINIVISNGPGPVEKYKKLEINLPAEKDFYEVVVVVHDAKGDHEVLKETHQGNTSFPLGVNYYGSGTVEVFLDGKKYQTFTM